jgi:hypothetical protein
VTRRRIRALRDGSFDVRLPSEERALLAALPRQLAAAIDEMPVDGETPEALQRLFPPAYLHDERAQASYGSVMRPELATHHREALETLLDTADKNRLTPEEIERWLSALNDLRLVIGTSLGVTEEMPQVASNDPRFGEWVLYSYLSFLEGEVIDALSGTLPPPVPGAGDDLPEDPWGEPLGDLRWDGTVRPSGPVEPE